MRQHGTKYKQPGEMAVRNYYVRNSCTLFFFILFNIDISKSINNYNVAAANEACRSINASGYGVDLSPLEECLSSGFRYLSARTNDYVYFYRPCSDFELDTKMPSECSKGGSSLCFFKLNNKSSDSLLDVETVLSGVLNGTFYKLAHASSATFELSEPTKRIIYKPNNTLTVTVTLLCDEHDRITLTVDKTNNPDSQKHNLSLKSKYSCFKKLTADKHMSGTAIFFILLLTFLSVYFCGGMLVLRYIKGATGTEMIPNYEFWTSIPRRIKDCFQRVTSGERNGTDTYERI